MVDHMELSSLIVKSQCMPLLKFASFDHAAPIFKKQHSLELLRKRKPTVLAASLLPTMLTSSYVGRENYMRYNANKIYTRLDSCLVVPPPKGQKPRAIIKFLGGAFIGAIPEVTYSYLLQHLAKDGYLIVSVPYNVTFDHAEAAREIYKNFHFCLDRLFASGLPKSNLTSDDLVHLPLYSVGHSNGALLQVLTGSYFSEKLPKANVVISYNNRPASEAVPYFELLGPLVSQLIPIMDTSPMYVMARSASGDMWKAFLDYAEAMIPSYDPEAMISLTNFVDQLPWVFGQLAQGVSEFRPTPSENLDCFKKSYNILQTLLVRFNFDGIDETDSLEETLMPRVEAIGGKLEKVTLNGSHITPCIQEPRWQVGYFYTPADAIAQGLKTLSLNDTKLLSRTITNWFNHLEKC